MLVLYIIHILQIAAVVMWCIINLAEGDYDELPTLKQAIILLFIPLGFTIVLLQILYINDKKRKKCL